MVCCWAANCSNRSEQGFKLYSFPNLASKKMLAAKENNPEKYKAEVDRRNKWISNVNRLDRNSNPRNRALLQPGPKAVLCEKHFTSDCFTSEDGKVKINSDAVPSIFSHMAVGPPLAKRRRLEIESPSTSQEIHVQPDVPTHEDVSADPSADVTALQQQVKELKSKLQKVQKQKRKADEKCQFVEKSVSKILNNDQVQALQRRSTRGLAWSTATIKKALRLRFSCGTTGYNEVRREHGLPLPSVSTLTAKLRHLNFSCGFLNSVFIYLQSKVQSMDERDRLCCLALDEMEISSGIQYDPSSKQMIGDITLHGHSGIAHHALVVMLTGVAQRWKQVVAYHFTGRAVNSKSLRELILQVIAKAFTIGLRVIAVTSDMGPANTGMWGMFGIHSKRDSLVASIAHPSDVSSKIHFLADVPHLLKNISSALKKHQAFFLAEDLCSQNGLTSRAVCVQHLRDLAEFQSERQLKLAPRLTTELLSTHGHFNKMSVAKARHILSKSVSAALRYLVAEEGRPNTYLTTAWFIDCVDDWFTLMTSRHPVIAISKRISAEHSRAVTSLQRFMATFTTTQIGHTSGWKPVQTGVQLSTTSMLNLCEELLSDKMDFVLTGRFTQDCVENLFSSVRSRNPTPNSREFKYALRVICVAQYLKPLHTSNYDEDDREYLGDLLPTEIIPPSDDEDIPVDELILHSVSMNLDCAERQSLYYLAGYCAQSLRKLKQACDVCLMTIQHDAAGSPHPDSRLLKLKNFKDGALFEVDDPTFQCFLGWEAVMRLNSHQMKLPQIGKLLIDQCSVPEVSALPTCHPLMERLKVKFITARLHFYCAMLNKQDTKDRASMASKSMTMRDLANKV